VLPSSTSASSEQAASDSIELDGWTSRTLEWRTKTVSCRLLNIGCEQSVGTLCVVQLTLSQKVTSELNVKE